MRASSGEPWGAQGFVRIVIPGEASATPGAAPVINYFRANVEKAYPGDIITFEWETKGGTDVHLYRYLYKSMDTILRSEEPRGTFTYAIPIGAREPIRLNLSVSDGKHGDSQSLSIPLLCPAPWFFKSESTTWCPEAPGMTYAAIEQHFEHGVMIFVREQDLIYVLFDDENWWETFENQWKQGDSENDPDLVPPEGLYQPVRELGLVWRDGPEIRAKLGWAIDTEASFTTMFQRAETLRTQYGTDYYIRALDGKIWALKLGNGP
jgi:hypothetical protein